MNNDTQKQTAPQAAETAILPRFPIPEGYRLLDEGEALERGDLFGYNNTPNEPAEVVNGLAGYVIKNEADGFVAFRRIEPTPQAPEGTSPKAPAADSSLPADLDSALVAIRGYFMESELGDRPYADLNLLLNALLDSRVQVASLVSTIAAARGALAKLDCACQNLGHAALPVWDYNPPAYLKREWEALAEVLVEIAPVLAGSQALVGGGDRG